ncbi:hypothetical protein [Proteiniclasticum sp.]|uniref:hypothetical protein n=1 Tax=Proteiniclasticum sp. TaxID=2053595 RepID=UPI0028989BB0|nr:hypothetical protein [Proteiniclasticum sp.]
MNDTRKLVAALKDIVNILGEERNVLIKSDAIALEKIVLKKNELISKINEEKKIGVAADEEVRILGLEIQRLQETNILLTRQSLAYQEEILKALAKSNTSKFNTYSAKGSMSNEKEVRLIDQSV